MSTMDKSLKEITDYTAEDARFMEMAINLSIDNIDTGGGPFGAVIVKDGKVISRNKPCGAEFGSDRPCGSYGDQECLC